MVSLGVVLALFAATLTGCVGAVIEHATDHARTFSMPPRLLMNDESLIICHPIYYWPFKRSGRETSFVVDAAGKWDKSGKTVILIRKDDLRSMPDCELPGYVEVPQCTATANPERCFVYERPAVDPMFGPDGISIVDKRGVLYFRLEPKRGNPAFFLLSPIAAAGDLAASPLYLAILGTMATDSP